MNEHDPSFDRRRFLQTLVQAGTGSCCCAPVLGLSALSQEQSRESQGEDWIADLENQMKEGSRTPAWRRMEVAEQWIQRLMGNMDALLDDETRNRLMHACGRACYNAAFGVRSEEPPPSGALDALLGASQARGETEIRREGNTVYYQYGPSEQNPYGLRILDGYCMCPVVESGPAELSPTYCQCSAGYVREMFERMTGEPCRVEVLESLRSGGSTCRFKVDILST
jgi:hypothetical protein